mgnify:CR=1 FL=1
MSTEKNLQEAFAGESQANRRYTAFARKADAEMLPNVAKVFRAAAAAETVHALSHLRVLGAVKSTGENLQAAIEGEAYEFKTMYPAFLSEAEKEKNAAAVLTFKGALAVEKTHHALYTKALEAVKAGSDLPEAPMWVCEVCGETFMGAHPDRCPVCNAPKAKFTEIK